MRGQRINRQVKIAKAEHPLLLRILDRPAHGAGDDRLFNRPCREKEPAIIGCPFICMWRQVRIGEGIRQIGADRRTFGDDRAIVDNRRHLAHRVDRQIVRPLHRLTIADQMLVIGRARFLQCPARNLPAGHGVGVECDISHGSIPRCTRNHVRALIRMERRGNGGDCHAHNGISGRCA